MTRVLIVEDNPAVLETIAFELEMRGYEVLPTSDGQHALDVLNLSNPLPDIIVSDIAMPDVDGFRLLELIRADPHWNVIPVLFLTAFNSPNSIRISKELGVDDYIVKPFQADDLVIAIENKLQRIQAFRQAATKNNG
jgi:DNA-binding response OmpR family regulator